MGYVAVVEAAQYVYDGICITYVAQKLVAQTFTLRGALYKARNVDNLNSGWNDTFGFVDLGQTHKTLIGYGDDTYVGFDRTEREIGRLRLSVRQAVEKSRFADIGQTDYTAL